MVVSPLEIAHAADVLRAGGVVAFPTETVYGLGADASSAAAVAKIYRLKGRPADHPVIVHLAPAHPLERWAREIPAAARRLAERFWPGPLTLILRRSASVLDAVTGGQDTVALRVPSHPVAQALLAAFDGGVAAPSANRFGRVSATTAAHVREEFGAAVEVVLELAEVERPVVQRRRQAEAEVDQRLLAGDVAVVHAAHLRDRDVRLVDEQQPLVGQVVQ